MNTAVNTRDDNRIYELKNLINKYEEFKCSDDSTLYIIYLELKFKQYEFLGKNNSTYRSIENYIKSDKCINSGTYSVETMEGYHCRLRKIFVICNTVLDKIDKSISLTDYEKDTILLKFIYGIDRNVEYPFELVSISLRDTYRRKCNANYNNASFQVPAIEAIKENNRLIDDLKFEYLRKDITFNIHKDNIDFITVKNKNETIENITVKAFEKNYGKLSWFISRETSENTINIKDESLYYCSRILRPFLSLKQFPKIIYTDNLTNRKAIGEYNYGVVNIKSKAKYSSREETLSHELGHYIHDVLLNNKMYKFSTEDKSKYASKNFYENFAECFKDLIYYQINNKRTEKMIDILFDIF